MDLAGYDACAAIVARAIRRIPGQSIGVLDADDLRQELLPHALAVIAKHDGRDGFAYVRKSVQNAIRDLYAETLAAKRHPRDRYGCPVHFASPDVLAWQMDAGPDPEEQTSVSEGLARLAALLPQDAWERVCQCLLGETELDDQVASYIRYQAFGEPASEGKGP